MKQKLPTLAGVILLLFLLTSCSVSRSDKETNCRVECSLCKDLVFECDRNGKSNNVETLPTPDIIIK
jgi:hypothetical protein